MKIAFLLHNAYGIGGTIRTTMNLATALADRHEVEIVSMMRHRETPRFALDPRVRLVPLVDTRPESADAKDPLFFEASRDFPAAEKRHHQYNRLIDTRAAEYLRGCPADVIIGTRPGVNVYISRFAPRRALRIAQEHLRYDAHSKKLRGSWPRATGCWTPSSPRPRRTPRSTARRCRCRECGPWRYPTASPNRPSPPPKAPRP